MPYIPLNRVKTNLYTSGGEYRYTSTKEEYAGPYHMLYNGRIFTQPSPDSENKYELEKIQTQDLGAANTQAPVSQIAYFNNDPDPAIDTLDVIPRNVLNYTTLKGGNDLLFKTYKLPTAYQPTPAESDYKTGEIIRYFTKKTNELVYVEVSLEEYTGFSTKSPQYAWTEYLTFSLPWQISGKEEEVGKVNRNMVLLTEQRNKIRGLQEFLRFDYLKFYKS